MHSRVMDSVKVAIRESNKKRAAATAARGEEPVSRSTKKEKSEQGPHDVDTKL